MDRGAIYSIAISKERGKLKKEVPEALVVVGSGIEGDGHAGDWDRQITCLNFSSVLKSNEVNRLNMGPGDFAENILIEGLDFSNIGVGSKLKLGTSVILEVSQVGKEDHPSVVTRNFGVSLLPSEGLFCKVIAGGHIKKGDIVEIIK
jgi:MOSC domain-containing protein YiiM